jgi:Type I phosphodiesterase / nucleotide pyrophosphatase
MSPRPVHVFVLIDALGWAFVEGRDFLIDVLPFQQPLRTVLGYSSGAIPTILTGRPPVEHGHWNLFYYDPVRSPFRWLRAFRALPSRALDNRVSRKLLTELGRRVLGLGPLFEVCVSPRLLSYFDFVEKRNIYAAGGIAGAPSIFDDLAQAGVPHRVYSYHRFTDAEVLRQAADDLGRGEAGFFFLYLSEMDAFLHRHCQADADFDRRLAWYGQGLRTVFAAARNLDPEATFAIFSDHGMTPVRRTVDLVREIEQLGLSMPDDYLAVYDSTMSRFWFFSGQARSRIAQQLGRVECGRILSDDDLGAMGILFPDRRYGELVFLLDPGWLVGGSDFNGQWTPAGMHGYHPDDPHSDGIFLSNHPPAQAVRTVADIHFLMSTSVQTTAQGHHAG